MGSRRVPSESAAGQQQPYKPTDATGSTVMSGSGGDPENALRFANKMLKKINMNCLQELTRVVRFRASEGGDLNQITECRKARTMKTLICLVASTVLILSTSGCATSSCNSGCETNGGLFSGGLFQGGLIPQSLSLPGQPIRSLFRGAPCSTCNAPAGQTSSYGPNVAPLCNSGSCDSGYPSVAPGQLQTNGPGVQYYDNSNIVPQAAPTPATVTPNAIPTPAVTEGSASRVPYSSNYPTIDAALLPPSL